MAAVERSRLRKAVKWPIWKPRSPMGFIDLSPKAVFAEHEMLKLLLFFHLPPLQSGYLICWRLLKFIPLHSWLNNGIFLQTKRTKLIALHKLFCTYN